MYCETVVKTLLIVHCACKHGESWCIYDTGWHTQSGVKNRSVWFLLEQNLYKPSPSCHIDCWRGITAAAADDEDDDEDGRLEYNIIFISFVLLCFSRLSLRSSSSQHIVSPASAV